MASYMTAACVGSWLGMALVAPEVGLELLLGMAGPLLVAVTSSAVVDRVFAINPGALTSVMVKAFGSKMLFFGTYVGLVLWAAGRSGLEPVFFIVSFCTYFIGLMVVEALRLRALFGHAMS